MNHADLSGLDKALNLDASTLAARDHLLRELRNVRTAEGLWDLYRTAAIPPGAHQVQLAETRRAIFWAVSAVASLMNGSEADHERLITILQGVQSHAEAELRSQLAQLGGLS